MTIHLIFIHGVFVNLKPVSGRVHCHGTARAQHTATALTLAKATPAATVIYDMLQFKTVSPICNVWGLLKKTFISLYKSDSANKYQLQFHGDNDIIQMGNGSATTRKKNN